MDISTHQKLLLLGSTSEVRNSYLDFRALKVFIPFFRMPTTKSGKYVLTRSPSDSTVNQSCWNDMGNFLLISFASIVVPSGYSNDYKMHHPRIKGLYRNKVLFLLNYFKLPIH